MAHPVEPIVEKVNTQKKGYPHPGAVADIFNQPMVFVNPDIGRNKNTFHKNASKLLTYAQGNIGDGVI